MKYLKSFNKFEQFEAFTRSAYYTNNLANKDNIISVKENNCAYFNKWPIVNRGKIYNVNSSTWLVKRTEDNKIECINVCPNDASTYKSDQFSIGLYGYENFELSIKMHESSYYDYIIASFNDLSNYSYNEIYSNIGSYQWRNINNIFLYANVSLASKVLSPTELKPRGPAVTIYVQVFKGSGLNSNYGILTLNAPEEDVKSSLHGITISNDDYTYITPEPGNEATSGPSNEATTEPSQGPNYQKSVEERVRSIIENYFGITNEMYNLYSSLMNDLGADSYDVVAIRVEIEDEFHISIDESDAQNLLRIIDIIDYLENNI